MIIREGNEFNKYDKIINETISGEKDLDVSYKPINSNTGGSSMFGNIKVKNIDGLMGYTIALRDCEKKGDNFFVNVLLTTKDIQENDLEKIIKLNESFAKKLNCSNITVEGGDIEIFKFYIKKGYRFEEGSYIGVKRI